MPPRSRNTPAEPAEPDPELTEPAGPVDPDVTDNDTADSQPAELPSEAELDARERELALRERELALAEREKQLAEREAAILVTPEVNTGPPGLPEYLLVLANGERIESPNATATAHDGEDGLSWPVVAAYPIPGKWGVPYDQHPDNPNRLQPA